MSTFEVDKKHSVGQGQGEGTGGRERSGEVKRWWLELPYYNPQLHLAITSQPCSEIKSVLSGILGGVTQHTPSKLRSNKMPCFLSEAPVQVSVIVKLLPDYLNVD